MRLLDTNVLIRLIAQDQVQMAAASTALFEAIEREEERVFLLDVALAEAVFVLTSRTLYGMSRAEVSQKLRVVVLLPNVMLDNKARCLRAFDLWLGHPSLSYVDAYVAAAAFEQTETEVYSFDFDFDRIDGVTRIEPVAP